ncbi:hypothetical protein BX661DRAFT_171258 [Kickxella alabastrina]|uniref:uncharacterized protein n=1 Tax=Kickxella alabastrina TaxID=61397 RepID=UPI00221FA14F|nr:uncharacterized protein BX661DRAFT_171258 [Kickxella alabastrina]KAI7827324.1 hypothetical protein BX661DRAFT_171258 [Kickxella alabastrina]
MSQFVQGAAEDANRPGFMFIDRRVLHLNFSRCVRQGGATSQNCWPRLKNPKHKYHVAMAAAAFNSVAVATTSAAVSVAAAATIVSVATATAATAASIVNNAQQRRNQWITTRPQSADIIRWIGEGTGWFKRNILCKVKQQLRDELAERNWEQYINTQPADNLKHIVRLSGWLRGKIEHKIRQRMRDELAAQQQQQQQNGPAAAAGSRNRC